jgi:hypothetical protein
MGRNELIHRKEVVIVAIVHLPQRQTMMLAKPRGSPVQS